MGVNAQTSVPKFTSGDVLTAANTNLLSNGIPVFSGTATRNDSFGGSGEKVLAEGQFAYLEDTNTTQYYDGAAWQPVGVAPGFLLIKSQTIGTTVSSVEVTDAFSATYDSYLITVSGGVSSVNEVLIGLKVGAATTGYYQAGIVNYYSDASATNLGGNNTASFTRAGIGGTSNINLNVFLQNPFLSTLTQIHAQLAMPTTTGYAGRISGFLNNSTSYTSFTLAPASGTLTGGTIRVYGYANS